MKTNIYIFPILIIVIIVLFSFRNLPQSFFEQDEWHAFGYHILLKDLDTKEFFKTVFFTNVFHYTPLTVLFIKLLFSLFGLNYVGYATVSIALHIIGTLLFFYFSKMLFKNNLLAFLSSALFGVMAAGLQATTWVMADIGTHGATIFILLTLITFFTFLSSEKKLWLIISLILFIVSLLFKEITIGFIVLMPLTLFLLGSLSLAKKLRYSLIIFILGVIYLSFRLTSVSIPIQTLQKAESNRSNFNLGYSIVTIAPRAVVQSFIPSFQIFEIAQNIASIFPEDLTGRIGSPEYEQFVLKKVFETVNFFFFAVFSIFFLVLFKRSNRNARKILFFGFCFIVFNSLVFIFAPEQRDLIYTIDSRNLYLTSIGTVILIIAGVNIFKRKKTIIILLLAYLVLNGWWLNKQIDGLVKAGKVRKEILREIKSVYPVLSSRVVFYTESDTSFYGLPSSELILPFQSGFGQTLLVWYKSTQNFPQEFFRNEFLWNITDQSYKEFDGRGFGYFRDFELLAQTVKKNNIPLDGVIAFRYKSDTSNIEDTTREIRGRLEGYLANKREIDLKTNSLVSASDNSHDARLAIDGRRETFWDSKIPYGFRQFFEFEFRQNFPVAQVRIDTYNNKDQNEVGFKILLSTDGKDWNEVFYSKRYPPTEDGIIDIYFKPTTARFLRIEQIGAHNYASWVIHELNIYETVD